MSDIILMVGIQGSGKSTWVKKFMEEHENSMCASRDSIRKALIGEEEYFSKEEEVWAEFCNLIIKGIDAEKPWDNILIDATHISIASRRKILNELVKNTNNTNKFNLKNRQKCSNVLKCD